LSYKENERIEVIWYNSDNFLEWAISEEEAYEILSFIRDKNDNKVTY